MLHRLLRRLQKNKVQMLRILLVQVQVVKYYRMMLLIQIKKQSIHMKHCNVSLLRHVKSDCTIFNLARPYIFGIFLVSPLGGNTMCFKMHCRRIEDREYYDVKNVKKQSLELDELRKWKIRGKSFLYSSTVDSQHNYIRYLLVKKWYLDIKYSIQWYVDIFIFGVFINKVALNIFHDKYIFLMISYLTFALLIRK